MSLVVDLITPSPSFGTVTVKTDCRISVDLITLSVYTGALAAKTEVSFEMVDYSLSSSSSEAITFYRTYTQLNAADFDGNPQFYFEIDYVNADASDRTITLRDITNLSDRATATATQSTSDNTRTRSTAFSPASGEVVYAITVPQTTGNNAVKIWAARIVVVQDSTATKTVIDIPLLSEISYGYTQLNDYIGYVGRQTGTTYGQYNPTFHTRWLKTASNWGTVSECALDIVHCSNNAAYTST
jgi:hypothetical protein